MKKRFVMISKPGQDWRVELCVGDEDDNGVQCSPIVEVDVATPNEVLSTVNLMLDTGRFEYEH